MENWITALSTLASAVAAIASVVVANKFGNFQKKQNESAQKIALFDKRYEIYKSIVDLHGIMQFVVVKNDTAIAPNYLVVANMVLRRYNLMKDKEFLVEQLHLEKVVKTAPKTESDQADRELFYLHWYANNQLLQLRSKILSEIQPAKFCFEESIYNILMHTIEEFFDYIIIFKDGRADEKERDNSQLIEHIKILKESKIFEKMEKYLAMNENVN